MEKEEKLMAESKSLWLALRDRYFEAETTDEEIILPDMPTLEEVE